MDAIGEFLSGWTLWLILAALLVIVELLTGTFAAFCLVGGCVVALACSLLGFGVEAQLAGAAVGTVVTFLAFKPLIRKQREARHKKECVSNMDALIGRTVVVAEAIGENAVGRVRIDGDNWQARTADGSAVAAGEKVRVAGYDSIVLIVERA